MAAPLNIQLKERDMERKNGIDLYNFRVFLECLLR